VTLAAAMATVGTAPKAADEPQARGIPAAVIGPRTIRPLGPDNLAKAAEATGTLTVIEDRPPLDGYSAAVLALAMERVPGVRARAVTTVDNPIPFSPLLEDSLLPSLRQVVSSVAQLLGR
jgi:acetoin:2,6-dichlorophenolindophenol oxidoreductase subunit beta